jgi:hypothetical protein
MLMLERSTAEPFDEKIMPLPSLIQSAFEEIEFHFRRSSGCPARTELVMQLD